MDCDEPHLAPNEKTQPIQWTKRPTGALVAVGSLWPLGEYLINLVGLDGRFWFQLVKLNWNQIWFWSHLESDFRTGSGTGTEPKTPIFEKHNSPKKP